MSDINKKTEIPEEEQKLTNEAYIQDENGSTYWESGEIQDLYKKQVGQSSDDIFQRTQDLTHEEFKKQQYELSQKKKSGKKPLVALIVLALILLIGATAYAFNGTIRNTIDLLIKSPRDYYISLENRSVEQTVDRSKVINDLQKAKENTAYNSSATLSYDKDTLSSLLKTYTGTTIRDIESFIGMPLDSLGLDLITSNKDEKSYQKIGLSLNNASIISGELFTDLALEQMLFSLPDLSPAYLKLSSDANLLGGGDINTKRLTDIIKILTSDGTGDFIKRYVKLITNEIEDVKLSRKEQLTVGNITKEANLLTINFYPKTLKNIFTKALGALKDDEYILSLLPQFDITKDEFAEEMNRTLDDISRHLDRLPQDKELMVMKVYVAGNGRILGRKLELLVENTVSEELGFFYVEQDKTGAFDVYIDNRGRSTHKIKGSHIKENGAYTGSLILEVADTSETTDITVEYEGLKPQLKGNKVFAYGSLSISSYKMMGMDIGLELDVKDDAQLFTIMLNMGRTALVTLETSTRQIDNFDIPKVDKNAKVYDITTESEAYISTIDFEGFISNLSDKLGVNLKSLIEGFIPMY